MAGEDLHRHDRVEALALEDAGGAGEVHVGRVARTGSRATGGSDAGPSGRPTHGRLLRRGPGSAGASGPGSARRGAPSVAYGSGRSATPIGTPRRRGGRSRRRAIRRRTRATPAARERRTASGDRDRAGRRPPADERREPTPAPRRPASAPPAAIAASAAASGRPPRTAASAAARRGRDGSLADPRPIACTRRRGVRSRRRRPSRPSCASTPSWSRRLELAGRRRRPGTPRGASVGERRSPRRRRRLLDLRRAPRAPSCASSIAASRSSNCQRPIGSGPRSRQPAVAGLDERRVRAARGGPRPRAAARRRR